MTFEEFLDTPESEDWQFLITSTTVEVIICGCRDGAPASGKGREVRGIGRTFSGAWLDWLLQFDALYPSKRLRRR